MDTIVALSRGRLVATHYGVYNTICGIGITVGNLLTGPPWTRPGVAGCQGSRGWLSPLWGRSAQ
jgi:hypothetical protein